MSKKRLQMQTATYPASAVPAGLAIPQKATYTRGELEEYIKRATSGMTEVYLQLDKAFYPLYAQSEKLSSARTSLFSALLFSDSPTWADGAAKLRDNYNSAVSALTDTLTQIAQTYPDPLLNELYNVAQSEAARINDAVRLAIATGNASALHELSQEHYPAIAAMLRAHFDAFRTDHLAAERRTARAKVYIGVRCNELEAAGMTKIEDMWKAIHRDLKARESELRRDMRDAWEWFQREAPFDKTPAELRRFHHEISRFKQDMKPEFIKQGKSGQSRDKAP